MNFESFLGNAQVVGALRDLLARGRVPGALLFTGPPGVGKKTLALIVAKAMNCERMKDDSCGECPRCHKAEQMLTVTRDDLAHRREIKDAPRRVECLIYFDIQLIEPLTRYILVEQIRQLRQVAYARPFEMPRRVMVIDEAQQIHWQAIDLLLKVLEEPPETTSIILVCPNGYELRPTLRSRCVHFQFQPVEESAIGELLQQEGRVPKAQLQLALRVASGSVAKAKTLDLADFERRRRPWLMFLESVAGGRKAAKGDAGWRALFDATRALTENRDGFEETLRIGYTLLRDLMILLEGGGDQGVVNVDQVAHLKSWAAALGLAGIERIKAGLDEARRFQIRNVNPQLGLDALATQLRAE